jgi:hypothetical protein
MKIGDDDQPVIVCKRTIREEINRRPEPQKMTLRCWESYARYEPRSTIGRAEYNPKSRTQFPNIENYIGLTITPSKH